MAPRYMQAAGSLALSGLWWLLDRLYGDKVFAVVRPMIPDWVVVGVPLSVIADKAISYGPPVLLFALAIYLLRRGSRERDHRPKIEIGLQSHPEKLHLLDEARDFVGAILKETNEIGNFKRKLEIEPVYLKLRPYLADKFKNDMDSDAVIIVQGSNIPGMAFFFLKELDRLEKEWGGTERTQQTNPVVSRTLVSESMSRLGETASLALNDGKLPLWQAAIRAYSDTDDSMYAELGRKVAGGGRGSASNDELLLWYVDGIARHCTIWGCRAPSDTTKPQQMSDYIFYKEGNGVIAKNGNSVIENLLVPQSDLKAFVEKVKRFPNEQI
jgi:hypothetical protein